jgi:coenzyme F420-dependent glucose-6-phosphate dehydrogenase
MELGYTLSAEEHSAPELVSLAQQAESAGFALAFISDHYHPWTDRQGHSPFAWSVVGALAQATERIRLGTAVTCPLFRVHPAVVAQAAATAAALAPRRFALGLGAGEFLNEHVVGGEWPPPAVRL